MNEVLKACWLALQKISLSDKITLLVVCITALSAEYARQAATQACKANDIALQSAFRAERLSVFRSFGDFLNYCSTYNTMLSVKMVDGTRALSERIGEFKWEIRQHGPLRMPNVEDLIKTAIVNANNLQRLLDRSTAPNPKPIDSASTDVDENIDKLVDWFSEQEKHLQTVFDPYI
jgi:hypothetical protein